MRKLITFLFVCIFHGNICSQQTSATDSLKKEYEKASDPAMLVELSGELSEIFMAISQEQSDYYGKKCLEHAELSRDRKLMVKAILVNAVRYSYISGKRENLDKSIGYYQQAYDVAKTNKLEEETAQCLLGLAHVHLLLPDADKSLSYTTQAFSILSNSSKDSLETECYLSFARGYLLKKDKLPALKNYFNAVRIAETIKNPFLLHTCYSGLSSFYLSVNDVDKSIDYAFKAKDMGKATNAEKAKYLEVNDTRYIGDLYKQKKNFEMAMKFYQQSLTLAGNLKFDALKIPVYIGILNMYLESDEPLKAKEYFNTSQALKDYLTSFGFGKVIDQSYGFIYTELGQYDSARYYYNRALPFYENETSNSAKINFYAQFARFYHKSGDYRSGIQYLLKSKAVAEQMADMEWQRRICVRLDSACQRIGDYRQAIMYAGLHSKLKDTLDKLSKEEDLLQLQIADEQERQIRLENEKEEKKKRRFSIQYMAITLAIAVLFIGLVMMGWFKVSSATIKAIGFFTFLLLFEFIFMMFKKNIYGITKGEPWKDLAVIIVLAAMLVPLHHWLEHRVIRFLTSHHMLKLRSVFTGKRDEHS